MRSCTFVVPMRSSILDRKNNSLQLQLIAAMRCQGRRVELGGAPRQRRDRPVRGAPLTGQALTGYVLPVAQASRHNWRGPAAPGVARAIVVWYFSCTTQARGAPAGNR